VVEQFEISDDIYRHLATLVKRGADGAELCAEWLPAPMIGDPPAMVDVSGTLADGTAVDVSFGCEPDSRPEEGARPPSLGGRDTSPD